jgi:hypothetical protein
MSDGNAETKALSLDQGVAEPGKLSRVIQSVPSSTAGLINNFAN